MELTSFPISYLGPLGDGVHVSRQGRIFIERTAPGDRVAARLRRDADGLTRGEVVELLEPSPFRQPPPCPHYQECGNCTLQHLQTEYYRRWKLELVRETLHRQGLRPRHLKTPIFIAPHTRRRATFTAHNSRNHIHLGYYRRRSQRIADIETCLIAHPRLVSVKEAIKPFLKDLTASGERTDFFFQLIGRAIDLVITGPIGRSHKPDGFIKSAVRQMAKAASIHRVSWRERERDHLQILFFDASVPIEVKFGEVGVALPPASFLQPTLEGEAALVQAVTSFLPAKGRFADLFSGCGTFTGPMLALGTVDAFEALPRAVHALSSASKALPLKVYRRDLFNHPLRREELNRYDAVVFDPPRAGCGEQAAHMAQSRVPLLIAVSCNPATFARDARILAEGGYWFESLQVVDQFLWSHHVEMVGVFTKKKRK